MKKWFLLFLVVVAIAASVAGYGFYKVRQLADSPLSIEQESVVTLEAGTGRLALARQLYQDKLIRQPRVFQWLLKAEPELANFKAGTYQLTPGMTVRQMLALFASGKEAQFPIRFVPGMRLKDLLAELRAAPFIKHQLTDDSYESVAKALGVEPPEALEGHFYPDTWMYTAGTSDIAILKRTQQKMTNALDKVWESRQKDLPYKNKLELLTMASIIEKETALASERDTVASVFINRLGKGMRLQTDPTVIYGMGESYTGKITRQALQTPTPYNTYVIAGLPPGPIAIPSLASLQSAAHPGDTPYLYFVADGKGGHTFSTTLNNHNKAVQVYIQSLREKNGQ